MKRFGLRVWVCWLGFLLITTVTALSVVMATRNFQGIAAHVVDVALPLLLTSMGITLAGTVIGAVWSEDNK